jgi:hypothetical protein
MVPLKAPWTSGLLPLRTNIRNLGWGEDLRE